MLRPLAEKERPGISQKGNPQERKSPLRLRGKGAGKYRKGAEGNNAVGKRQ